MNTLDKVRKAPSNKTMGLELEVICTNADISSGNYYGFYYCGSDGSLSRDWDKGGRGREFVSQPLTYEWLRKETTKLYKKLGAEYYVNPSCGIHIHVSKKWLSDNKALNIWKFLATLTSSEFQDLFGRRPNNYCEIVSDLYEQKNSRYVALNMTNNATNEFRMFASGNLEWSLYCLACAKYMVDQHAVLNYDAFMAFRAMYPNAQPG